MNVDEKRIAELAVMATALDPKKVAEANAKMEADLLERMKSMSHEERMKLLAVQKIVTERAVQTLGSLNDGQGGLNLDAIKSSIDPKTLNDEKVLMALRSHDIDALQRELQVQGRDSFTTVRFVSDPEGHPLLHWAALDNNLAAVNLLFSEVSLTKHHKLADQRNVRGETPLIWACMKGHSRMVCELLRRGADVHAACAKGYTAMHVAAQNGHVFTMAQLARRGLPVDVRDNNGRTPLHWAAYKGFEHATKWLLSHGADPSAQDWEKCTPLHWASLRANIGVAAILVEQGASGAYFNLKDKTGGTPLELAEQKVNRIAQDLQSNPENEKVPGKNTFTKHSYEAMVSYFKRLQVVQNDIDANGGHPTLMLRIRAKMPHWSYFLWPILAPIGWWQYATVVWPVTSHHLLLHAIFAVCFWAKWVFWIRLQIRDPGEYVEPHGPPGTTLGTGPSLPSWGWRRGGMPDFTNRKSASPHNGNDIDTKHKERKPGTGDVEEALRLVSSDVRATRVTSNPRMSAWAAKHRALYDRVLDEGLAVPVCLTCEIVKPVRAKHDKISDVCVAKFDHFCPWMNSCVGELNYTDFFFTALSATIAMWAWLILVVYYTWEVNTDNGWWTNFIDRFWWEMFAWMYSLMALYGLAMTAQHIHLAAKNLSTNEMISGYRYRYLVEDGTRGNPFHRGVLSNFAELLGILPPLRIDPEEYYSVELAGGPLRPVPLPPVGSPWNRSSMGGGGGHGHSHGVMDEESHGHSHGSNGNSHNHSHAHGGGHSHAQGNHHGHSH